MKVPSISRINCNPHAPFSSQMYAFSSSSSSHSASCHSQSSVTNPQSSPPESGAKNDYRSFFFKVAFLLPDSFWYRSYYVLLILICTWRSPVCVVVGTNNISSNPPVNIITSFLLETNPRVTSQKYLYRGKKNIWMVLSQKWKPIWKEANKHFF